MSKIFSKLVQEFSPTKETQSLYSCKGKLEQFAEGS